MKNVSTKLFCLLIAFSFGLQMASAQQLGRAGGGSGFFNTSTFGGQLGHEQTAGTFGVVSSASKWISIGQPFLPSGDELYGMRIQDKAFVGTFSMNPVEGRKDLEITYGRISGGPFKLKSNLNFRSINNAFSTALRMTLTRSGTLGIGSNPEPSSVYRLVVDGATFCSSGVWDGSDARYKKNIRTVENASDKLKQLEGVNYEFKTELINGIDFRKSENKTETGFIAQELEKVFPHLVKQDENGYRAVRYTGLIPVLVEGFKEQAQTIEEQESLLAEQKEINVEQENTIAALTNQLQSLEKQMQQIMTSVNQLEGSARLELTPKFSKESIGTLEQNRPNPFKGITTIAYELPANTTNAQLQVVNLQGQQIAVYEVNDRQGNIDFDGSGLASGTYFYSLIVDGKNMAQQKMVIQ